jgi:hypothetical protein
VHCVTVGVGGGLDSGKRGSRARDSTMHRVHGREKQMWSKEQGIEGIAQERSDSTGNGSRAKERRTSSLIFGDALEQPGGSRVGRERRERGMGARRGGESGTSSETSAEAS